MLKKVGETTVCLLDLRILVAKSSKFSVLFYFLILFSHSLLLLLPVCRKSRDNLEESVFNLYQVDPRSNSLRLWGLVAGTLIYLGCLLSPNSKFQLRVTKLIFMLYTSLNHQLYHEKAVLNFHSFLVTKPTDLHPLHQPSSLSHFAG